MISLLRVDDKLLHGQIAFSWVTNLKIHTIVIADDDIVYDEFMKMTLGLSKPNGIYLEILNVENAIKVINDYHNSDIDIMVVVKNIENAYRIFKCIPYLHSLNLGSLRQQYDSKLMIGNIALNDREIELCKELIKEGKEIEVRACYHDKKRNLKDDLDKIEKL